MTIADKLGSQEPISNGLTYRIVKVNTENLSRTMGTYFIHRDVVGGITVRFCPRWARVENDQRQGDVIFLKHRITRKIGP